MSERYAEVAPAVPLAAGGRQAYTYKIPARAGTIELYSQVRVWFGKRRVTGVVVGFSQDKPPGTIKEIINVGQDKLTKEQAALAHWIAEVAHGGLGFTLRLFNSPGASSRLAMGKGYDRGKRHRPTADKQSIFMSLGQKPSVLLEKDVTRRNHILNNLVNEVTVQGGQTLTIVPEKHLLDSGPGHRFSAGLSSGEIAQVWHGVKNGAVTAVRGTQKAIFLPFAKLKLIIIEEEQYSSHKLWDQYPRLHNIDAALAMSKIYNCPLLLVSSYPSLLVHRALKDGTMIAINNNVVAPRCRTVEYSFEEKLKKLVLPSGVISHLVSWVAEDQEVLIFSNRRDNRRLFKFLSDNLTGWWRKKVTVSTSAIFTRGGTGLFDQVIWLWPEQVLTYPDFRSYERTRIILARLQQLLTKPENQIMLITRQPRLVEDELASPLEQFVGRELALRKRLCLPPYTDQVRLTVGGVCKEEETAGAALREQLGDLIAKSKKKVLVRGPFSSLGRKNKKNEEHIILRGQLSDIAKLYADVKIEVADVSPENVL